MSLFFVRGTVHPLSLVKTRLQMQRNHVKGALEASGDYRHARYKGTFDAFSKIVRHEGVRGLFKVRAQTLLPALQSLTPTVLGSLDNFSLLLTGSPQRDDTHPPEPRAFNYAQRHSRMRLRDATSLKS